MTALVLVMTLVVAAMGVRSSILVGLSIPTCILFACLFLSPIGYSFNFMVCFGILISLGMLIDGAPSINIPKDIKIPKQTIKLKL